MHIYYIDIYVAFILSLSYHVIQIEVTTQKTGPPILKYIVHLQLYMGHLCYLEFKEEGM